MTAALIPTPPRSGGQQIEVVAGGQTLPVADGGDGECTESVGTTQPVEQGQTVEQSRQITADECVACAHRVDDADLARVFGGDAVGGDDEGRLGTVLDHDLGHPVGDQAASQILRGDGFWSRREEREFLGRGDQDVRPRSECRHDRPGVFGVPEPAAEVDVDADQSASVARLLDGGEHCRIEGWDRAPR